MKSLEPWLVSNISGCFLILVSFFSPSGMEVLHYKDASFTMLASVFPECLSPYTEFAERLKIEGKKLTFCSICCGSVNHGELFLSKTRLSCSCVQASLRHEPERDREDPKGGEHVSVAGHRLFLSAGVSVSGGQRGPGQSSPEHRESHTIMSLFLFVLLFYRTVCCRLQAFCYFNHSNAKNFSLFRTIQL